MTPATIAKTLLAAVLTVATAAWSHAARPGASAIVAHRGYWNCEAGEYAQNSLAALESAQKAGFWGVEFDVNMTSDGELLVFHDSSIDRKRIDQYPYAEFRDYRLKNGEPIPTLDRFLTQAKRHPKTMLVLEVKTHSTAEIENRAIARIIETLKAHGLFSPRRVMFFTFSPNASVVLARSVPGFTVQYVGSNRRPEEVARMGMNGVSTWCETLLSDPTWYPEARKLGMSVNTWTVDDPAQMEALFAMGVDQLTTDEPAEAREVLSKMGMREVKAGKKIKK